MTIVTTLGKGQVVIPKAIRDRLGLTAGRKLAVEVHDDKEIILHPLPKNPIDALCGILKGSGPSTKDLLKMRREERRREERKTARFLRPH
ncbi:MAG: AbrB/MazE/SpoVT family DNA-binding domain-containing protein [Candidatus Omnitrophica bacterium]|nr:AbrB/MazE/SpoVT family DNA-binding domain-containing protein [Candidatus Omnitrophota bacterium]